MRGGVSASGAGARLTPLRVTDVFAMRAPGAEALAYLEAKAELRRAYPAAKAGFVEAAIAARLKPCP